MRSEKFIALKID